jgi:hypothetical protein
VDIVPISLRGILITYLVTKICVHGDGPKNTWMAKMTDEELAVATLEMMGYEERIDDLGCWINCDDTEWNVRDALYMYDRDSHAFAAEVKEFMRQARWACSDTTVLNLSRVKFFKGGLLSQAHDYEADAYYDDMAAHPRAVCEAAIAALKVDRGNDGKDDG